MCMSSLQVAPWANASVYAFCGRSGWCRCSSRGDGRRNFSSHSCGPSSVRWWRAWPPNVIVFAVLGVRQGWFWFAVCCVLVISDYQLFTMQTDSC